MTASPPRSEAVPAWSDGPSYRERVSSEKSSQAAGGTMVTTASLGALASRFIETEKLPWIETTPGNKMKVIYHDPATDTLTILAKLEPGAGIPAHVHEDLEQTFVLEGSWSIRKANAPPAISSS